jgi:hypothetical protein
MERRLRFLTLVVLAVLVLTLSGIAVAADVPDNAARPAEVTDPLVRVLLTKGILSEEEASALAAAPATEQHSQLVQLLLKKGVLSPSDVAAIPSSNERMVNFSTSATVKPAVMVETMDTSLPPQAAPKPPPVIAAIAPIRVLQSGPAKVGGLVPTIKLPNGAKLALYGFLKSSVVYDTSNQFGNDFPLPGFLGDTGSSGSPQFHIKARAARVGVNFEWPDVAKNLALTGKLEFDFEGNFTRTNNRNISSIRSSTPSIRLAYMRLEHIVNDQTSVFVLFGQDWTPFASSTLPNLVETTGLGIGFGSLYERDPQVRFGVHHKVGGSRSFAIQPEFAIVLPASGITPTDLGNQLGYGERLGPDSARPGIQGRLVFQFQLDKARGVAPAQIIVSGMQGSRRINIARAALLAAAQDKLGIAAGTNFVDTAFPRGAEVNSDTWGGTAEIQLPTRYVTLIGKYYSGADLRWFFEGQLYSVFNNTAAQGLTNTFSVAGLDGNTAVFGLNPSGAPDYARQRPVRGRGGFVNLGFPLSRIFNADPEGRNAGWTMYLHYGVDQAVARDIRKAGGANGRQRGNLAAANLQYKMNKFVTFAYEQSWYQTKAIGAGSAFEGTNQHEMHDIRSEFATIFTF